MSRRWLPVLKMPNVSCSLHACFLLKTFVNLTVLAPKEKLQMEVVMSLIVSNYEHETNDTATSVGENVPLGKVVQAENILL